MFARGRAHVCLADVCAPEMARFSPPLRGCVCVMVNALVTGFRLPFDHEIRRLFVWDVGDEEELRWDGM